MKTNEIPYGYCHCGCGQKTKGHNRKYVHGHYAKTRRKAISIESEFWSKVDKRGPGECWLWTSHIDGKGYGRIYRMIDRQRFTYAAHRFSYELHKGPIPAGLNVCHSCDTPLCVNPAHLWVGTHKQNNRDCLQKGRRYQPNVVGSNNGRAKLNEYLVRYLRQLHASGITYSDLAKQFGMHETSISAAVQRKTWRHV